MQTKILPDSPDSILETTRALTSGEVVAMPTETVYGLAGNAFRTESVAKIFAAKERPFFDPLIVHISKNNLNWANLQRDGILAPLLPSDLLDWLDSFVRPNWPGPLTVVLPKGPRIPGLVTSGQPTVGLRCPNHRLFQAVLDQIDFPLAAPSANRFGRISPTTASSVFAELDGKIPYILNGGVCTVGVESTILRPVLITDSAGVLTWTSIEYLRPGAIGIDEVQASTAKPVTLSKSIVSGSIQPGQLDMHYAPQKKLSLWVPNGPQFVKNLNAFENTDLVVWSSSDLSKNWIAAGVPNFPSNVVSRSALSLDGSSISAAGRLFELLRHLDQTPSKQIFVVLDGYLPDALTDAVLDRLSKAASK